MMAGTKTMTLKMVMFCREYIIDYNATQAAIRAGYSEATSGAIGQENLKKPTIKAYIDELTADQAAAAGITKEKILAELKAMAFADSTKLYNEDGTPRPISEIDEQTAKAIIGIKSISTKSGEKILEYKLSDKGAAIDKLMKHSGLYEPVKIDAKISSDSELIINIVEAKAKEPIEPDNEPDSEPSV